MHDPSASRLLRDAGDTVCAGDMVAAVDLRGGVGYSGTAAAASFVGWETVDGKGGWPGMPDPTRRWVSFPAAATPPDQPT